MEALPLTTYVLNNEEYSRYVAAVAKTQPAAQFIPVISSQNQFLQTKESTFVVITITRTTVMPVPTSSSTRASPVFTATSNNSGVTQIPSTLLGPAVYFTDVKSSSASVAATRSLLDTLLVDEAFVPTPGQNYKTVPTESSHTLTSLDLMAPETTLPTSEEQSRTGITSTTHVIVIVVAIGGIITVLVSVSVIVMYCIRSRTLRGTVHNPPGGSKPMGFRDMFRRKVGNNRVTAMASRASIGSFFVTRRPPPGAFGSGEVVERPITKANIYGNSEPPPPTPPIPIPERPSRPKRPERTPSTFLHDISRTASWDLRQQETSLPAQPDFLLTRCPLVDTPLSGSDQARSPGILDDGAPLPEPPPRPQHFPPRPVTGVPFASLSMANRHSVPIPLNLHQLTAFYGVPGGDLSSITYTTAPESPATHVPSPLSPPPPVRFSTQSRHKAYEADEMAPTKSERLNSLYTGSIGYLRGSQAASSNYNSVLLGPNSIYSPTSYNYFRYQGGGTSSLDPLPANDIHPLYSDPKKKSNASMGNRDIYRNTYGTYSSSMTDLPSMRTPSARAISETFTDTLAMTVGGSRETALAILGGNFSFTPAARQSSVRGSGSVNCSKPSLVSLTDSQHGSEAHVEVTAEDSAEEENEDGPKIVLSRVGNHQSISTSFEPSVSNRASKVFAASSKDDGSAVEGPERCTSGTESLSSCSTTGSSILYANDRGFNLELPQEVNEEPLTFEGLELGAPQALTTLFANNSSDTFGSPSQSLYSNTGRGLTAGGFTFPSPGTKGMQSGNERVYQSTPLTASMTPSEFRRASASSNTILETNHTFGSPRPQTPSLVIDSDSIIAGDQDFGELNSGVSGCVHAPSMNALINKLKKQKKNCTCNCSSSSLYSISSCSKSANSGKFEARQRQEEAMMGHSRTSSRSSDYNPPPAARESVTAYLTTSLMSSSTLALSTPGTTVSDLTLPSESDTLNMASTSDNNMLHTTQQPFLFPFQSSPEIHPTSRHSLPQPHISFMLPRSPTTSNIPTSPYSSPRLAYTPSPFSPRRLVHTPSSPRPMTRGKHKHYRSNSFSGGDVGSRNKSNIYINHQLPRIPTSSLSPSTFAIEAPGVGIAYSNIPEKSYTRVGKVMSMMTFPRISALFGTTKSDSAYEKSIMQSSPSSPTMTSSRKRMDDALLGYGMV